MNSRDVRKNRHATLSRLAAQLDPGSFHALLERATNPHDFWRQTGEIQLGSQPVFVKRLPVTDLEYAHPLSTANLYRLPAAYHYGVGSLGFGAFRELALHRWATDQVLDDAVSGFPLLYHSRIVPVGDAVPAPGPDLINRHVKYWGGHPGVRRYVEGRAKARHELVLFLEHFPQTLSPWLVTHSHETSRMLGELRDVVGFLREHDILHLDAHFQNVVTDGQAPYLTDFGLALDRSFELDDAERAFFRHHQDFDYGVLLWSLASPAVGAWRALSATDKSHWCAVYDIPDNLPGHQLGPILLAHIEEMCADGALKLDRDYVGNLLRFRNVSTVMGDFFTALTHNLHKDTPFPEAALHQNLLAANFLPNA